MYVDITSVTYNAKTNEAIITGTDLDNILLNDWSKEFPENAERKFCFSLANRGPRIYLFKLLRSQVREDCKSMEDMLMHLQGHITNISSNFLADAEG